MKSSIRDAGSLAAIDVHVHLEPTKDNTVDSAARKYFGDSKAPRGSSENKMGRPRS